MNFMRNNTEHIIDNQTGFTNVSGNSNRIIVRGSDMTMNINGNNNQFRIEHSRVNFTVNGNSNQFYYQNSNVTFGFNGSNNHANGDQNTVFHCQYNNGHNNSFTGVERNNRQRQPRENPNNGRRGGSGNQRQINVQRNQRNNNQFVNNRQRVPQQYVNNRPHVNQLMGANFGMLQNTFQVLQRNMQAMMFQMNQVGNFQNNNINQRNQRNNHYQFRPRNVYVFNQHAEEGGEEENGLKSHELSLLPRSKRQGANGNCTICMCDVEVGEEQTFLMCFHSFHWVCIKDWMIKNAKCPVCQYDVKQYLSS